MAAAAAATTSRRRCHVGRRGVRAALVGAVTLATVRNTYRMLSSSSSSSSSGTSSWAQPTRYGGDDIDTNSTSTSTSTSNSPASIQQDIILSVLQYASLPSVDRVQQFFLESVLLRDGSPDDDDEDDDEDDNDDKEASESSDSNTQKDESFSACLLWMDDNFRLTEWVAYHYYMMNLRYVVVAVDPRSQTSPWDVLRKWTSRMTVEVWTHDSNFTNLNLTIQESDSLVGKRQKHMQRQGTFYQKCAMHLKALNRTWTSFHDSDEYLVVTKLANVSEQSLERRPGAVLRIVQKYGRQQRELQQQQQQQERQAVRNSSLYALASNGTTTVRGENSTSSSSTSSSTGDVVARDWVRWFSTKPCVTIPRVLFSAVSSSSEEVTHNVPSFVQAHQFDTLRYRMQATPTKGGATDGVAKSIVDLSRLPWNAPNISNGEGSAHRPFKSDDICTHVFPPAGVLPLVIHHYLGSWEAFSFRDDARKGGLRTREKWEERSVLSEGGINDAARPWIRGFVRMVGERAALELLRDAGLPPGYRKSDNETLEWVSRRPAKLASAR